jgi:hypothetical protein
VYVIFGFRRPVLLRLFEIRTLLEQSEFWRQISKFLTIPRELPYLYSTVSEVEPR